MLDEFVIRALLAGVGVALMSGPLGSVMVWKRMAFFGDALSHSALLGVALGLIVGLNVTVGILIATLVFSLILARSQKQQSYSSDTVLGILAHSALAIGLVVIALANIQLDLYSFLFGDILSASWRDICFIASGVIVTYGVLYRLWKPLVLTTINRDLAQVEGVNTQKMQAVFMLLVSVLVALAVKIVGVLLVTSLLIIPAATARLFATTPERMAGFASFIGAASVALGIAASMLTDVPTGPAIVVAAGVLFLSGTVLVRR